MGYDTKQVTVVGHVSRHNSPRDAEDDAKWDELVKRIDAIVDEEQYASINAMVV